MRTNASFYIQTNPANVTTYTTRGRNLIAYDIQVQSLNPTLRLPSASNADSSSRQNEFGQRPADRDGVLRVRAVVAGAGDVQRVLVRRGPAIGQRGRAKNASDVRLAARAGGEDDLVRESGSNVCGRRAPGENEVVARDARGEGLAGARRRTARVDGDARVGRFRGVGQIHVPAVVVHAVDREAGRRGVLGEGVVDGDVDGGGRDVEAPHDAEGDVRDEDDVGAGDRRHAVQDARLGEGGDLRLDDGGLVGAGVLGQVQLPDAAGADGVVGIVGEAEARGRDVEDVRAELSDTHGSRCRGWIGGEGADIVSVPIGVDVQCLRTTQKVEKDATIGPDCQILDPIAVGELVDCLHSGSLRLV